jgi:para-nitrobenzyl esterase|tara:strand:+ start:12550 stop:14346 length:1797 start_codon:yes stop_codon:yes gene_type:complete
MTRITKSISHVLICIILFGCATNQDNFRVNTDQDTFRKLTDGSVIGYSQNETSLWLGIPYAKPPLNDLRWRSPKALDPWDGIYKATEFSEACTQIGSTFGDPLSVVGSVHGSEDCLYLNIFAPKNIAINEKLPVMFWIHGGSNTIGTSSLYDPSVLASSQRVIVVTINYRLGMFGWFIHPSIKAMSLDPEDKSGNYGTLDQIAALKWVQSNIDQFNGDKNNITIFGESAGGHNAYALMFSPMTTGLFHKVISQSGSTKTSTLDEMINYFDAIESPGNKSSSKEVMNQLLVADKQALNRDEAILLQEGMVDSEIYDYLKSRTKEQIIQTYYNNLDEKDYMHHVINDGFVLPKQGMDFMNTEKLKDIPIILGTNRDEMKLFLAFDPEFTSQKFSMTFIKNQDFYDISSEYGSKGWKVAAVDKPASELVKSGNQRVFGYRFDWDEEPKLLMMDFAKILGAAHAIEIPFVMGGMKLGGLEEYMFDKNNIAAATRLSETMMSYWSEFAYNGDPNRGRDKDQAPWRAWNNEVNENKYVIIDTPPDGGIRMSKKASSYSSLMEELLLDSRIPNDDMRCEFLQKALDANWFVDEKILKSGLCKNVH